jgi:hypothetical protein
MLPTFLSYIRDVLLNSLPFCTNDNALASIVAVISFSSWTASEVDLDQQFRGESRDNQANIP